MLRRSPRALVGAIPRSVWDPVHHDQNWVDSFAKPIAERRVWPSKQYSIGLEPQTPHDWLRFSKRNLAYAYNGALRACTTFPQMVPLYQEMKRRGVLLDLDTMFIMLSRAARYDKMEVPDVFLLFDEMTALGARSDISVAEVLHTLWEHSVNCDPHWRENRRRQLVDLYNDLAKRDIVEYGSKKLDKLLISQVGRYRENVKTLGETLRYEVWEMFVKHLNEPEDIIRSCGAMLQDRVPKGHPFKTLKYFEGNIPLVHTVLRRPGPGDALPWSSNTASAKYKGNHATSRFEDHLVCQVFVAALERLVDANILSPRYARDDKQTTLILSQLLWTSGVLVNSDFVAQAMEIVKFSQLQPSRKDFHAQIYLKYAVRGSNAEDDELPAWMSLEQPLDARVIGRYLASRNPWDDTMFTPEKEGKGSLQKFRPDMVRSPAAQGGAEEQQGSNLKDKTEEDAIGEAMREAAQSQIIRTDKSVAVRWEDARALLKLFARTHRGDALQGVTPEGELTSDVIRIYSVPNATELFTGQAAFLRNMFFGASQRGEKQSLEVVKAIFKRLRDLKREMDVVINANLVPSEPLLPEVECWESMLALLRGMMDHSVKSKNADQKKDADAFFLEVAEMRQQMINESKDRWDGRFKVMWLQEM